MDKIETPNLDKLKEVEDAIRDTADFIEWLRDERGIILASYVPSSTNIITNGISRERFMQPYDLMTVEQLLHEYVCIDTEALEQEKQKIVAAYMKKQEESSD